MYGLQKHNVMVHSLRLLKRYNFYKLFCDPQSVCVFLIAKQMFICTVICIAVLFTLFCAILYHFRLVISQQNNNNNFMCRRKQYLIVIKDT